MFKIMFVCLFCQGGRFLGGHNRPFIFNYVLMGFSCAWSLFRWGPFHFHINTPSFFPFFLDFFSAFVLSFFSSKAPFCWQMLWPSLRVSLYVLGHHKSVHVTLKERKERKHTLFYLWIQWASNEIQQAL